MESVAFAGYRATSGLPPRRLLRVLERIHDCRRGAPALAELATLAQMSPSHFKVLFKRSVGLPVHQYVIRARVAYALRLLVASDAPLSSVALEAGFANQSHMALWMRRTTGLTPRALRRAG